MQMRDNLSFTDRSNATRAAKRLVAQGTAPAPEFTIRTRDDGRFEIVWLTDSPGLAMAAWPAPTPEPTAAMSPDQALDAICGDGTADEMRAAAAAEPQAKPARKARVAKAKAEPKKGKGPRAKYAAPVAPGVMPAKPVLTTAGFTASYQKRIDSLAELAEAGDWAAVAAYEVKGRNTYSKIVIRYRDALVAARPGE
jgi:hypothetical protein